MSMSKLMLIPMVFTIWDLNHPWLDLVSITLHYMWSQVKHIHARQQTHTRHTLIWSTLTQVTTCCLMTPGHYPNGYSFTISMVQWHSSDDVFTKFNKIILDITYLTFHSNSRRQRVNGSRKMVHIPVKQSIRSVWFIIFQNTLVGSMSVDALAHCATRSSSAMLLAMYDKYVLAFYVERFEHPAPYQCGRIVENYIKVKEWQRIKSYFLK